MVAVPVDPATEGIVLRYAVEKDQCAGGGITAEIAELDALGGGVGDTTAGAAEGVVAGGAPQDIIQRAGGGCGYSITTPSFVEESGATFGRIGDDLDNWKLIDFIDPVFRELFGWYFCSQQEWNSGK